MRIIIVLVLILAGCFEAPGNGDPPEQDTIFTSSYSESAIYVSTHGPDSLIIKEGGP